MINGWYMSIYWINHDIDSLYDDIPINPLAIHIFLIQISFLLKYVHVFPLFPIYLHAIPLVSPQYHHEKHGRGRPKHQCHIDTGRQRGVVRRLLVTYDETRFNDGNWENQLFVYGNHLWENRTITGIFNNDVPYGNLWEIDCFFGGRLWDINCFLNGKLLGTRLGRLWKHRTFWEVLGNYWTWWKITPAILWEYSSDGICKDSNHAMVGMDIDLVEWALCNWIMESCIVFFKEAGEKLWTHIEVS